MFLSIFIGTLSPQTTLYLSDVPDELSTPLRALTGEHELLSLNSRDYPEELVGTFPSVFLRNITYNSIHPSPQIMDSGLTDSDPWTRITDSLSQCSSTLSFNVPYPRPDLQIHTFNDIFTIFSLR